MLTIKMLCPDEESFLKKIMDEIMTTEVEPKNKKAIFLLVVLMSLFQFFITYKACADDLLSTLWKVRHFIGIAFLQSVIQISTSWYVTKNKVPNYIVVGVGINSLLFITIYCILVILVAKA